jgi:hypothetical protein
MKKVIFSITAAALLLLSPGAEAQTRKQIKEAFNRVQSPVLVVYYVKDKATYKKKLNRLLKILEELDLDFSFKARFEESKKNKYTFVFKEWKD